MTYDEPSDLYEKLDALNVSPDLYPGDPNTYHKEEHALTKALAPLGVTIERWFNYEADSFGPLVRGCRITSTNPTMPSGYYSYG
jgi:hypothetical protein